MSALSRLRDFGRDLWLAVTAFQVTWIRALSAEGDGPPNWFWPSLQTGTVLALAAAGLYFAADRSAYVLSILPILGTFCGVTFVAWLGYRGWRSKP